MRKEGIVLLFMKAPAGGRVKSRLAADLGEDAAAEIYRNFVLDSVSMLEAAGGPFRICFYPRDAEAHVVGWLGPGYRYMAQEGNDLGERMENAFSRVFSEGFRRVVLIGSDIPDLPASFVRAAFAELRTHDVVLGPAQDGGYYLIGLNRHTYIPEAFRGIRWSTGTVLIETLGALRAASRQVRLLGEWSDVDSLKDLKALFARNGNTPFSLSRTMSYLRSKGIRLTDASDKGGEHLPPGGTSWTEKIRRPRYSGD